MITNIDLKNKEKNKGTLTLFWKQRGKQRDTHFVLRKKTKGNKGETKGHSLCFKEKQSECPFATFKKVSVPLPVLPFAGSLLCCFNQLTPLCSPFLYSASMPPYVVTFPSTSTAL
jgi:hypothetical protein